MLVHSQNGCSQELHLASHVRNSCPNIGAIFSCFSQTICMELDQKWSHQNTNIGTNIGYPKCRWRLSLLCHKTSLSIYVCICVCMHLLVYLKGRDKQKRSICIYLFIHQVPKQSRLGQAGAKSLELNLSLSCTHSISHTFQRTQNTLARSSSEMVLRLKP